MEIWRLASRWGMCLGIGVWSDRLQLLAYSMMMNANNIGIILPAQDEVEIFDARRINSMENRVVKYHQMLLGVMKDNPVIANYIKTNAFKKKE